MRKVADETAMAGWSLAKIIFCIFLFFLFLAVLYWIFCRVSCGSYGRGCGYGGGGGCGKCGKKKCSGNCN